jgi:ABC-type transport system involved in multi-copper enzyme maturation permease subunit
MIKMISVHNITSIAKYEITTLLRSWFFRIFALLAIVILFFFNMAVLAMDNGGNWNLKAIASLVPYINLLLLNTVQAIIAIFLASDFLKRDKKLDTTDVIYIRSMSNGEYVAGKTIGNLIVFIILNLIILSEALVFNMMAENLAVNWLAYLEYFLIISLPTLIFILGLSFFVMSILKNQAITFILLLGYVAITIFYLNTKYYFLFDYMAYSMPLLNSDFMGFGNLPAIIVHRGMYTCFGIAFIFLTVSLLKRLPQSPYSNKVTLIPALVFFIGGIWLGKMHVSSFVKNQELRENMRSLNDANQTVPRLKVENYRIELNHKGDKLEVTAKMKVSNPYKEAISHFVFSLNPGLNISKVSFNGKEITPMRELQLVEFSGSKLEPGETAELEFIYSGGINEAQSYLDIDDKTLQEPFKANLYQIDKRSAIVSSDFVLLTRESNWYPVAGTGFGKQSKQWMQKQFSNFEITVNTKPGLIAISQGKLEQKEGTFHYTNKHNLSQISLIIGNYIQKTSLIDGLNFNLYYHKDHDYFSKFFEPIKDTIPTLIGTALKDYERKIDMYYPFERFTVVEVPAQFFSYPRTLIGERDQVQPETILFPEKGLLIDEADFAGSIKRMERWGGRGDQATSTPEEKKTMVFNNFLSMFTQAAARPSFNQSQGQIQVTEKANPLYFFPMFYNYAYFVQSDQWPITDRIFESYLKKSSESGAMGFMRNMQGTTENEKANLALLDHSFAELLDDPEKIQIIDNVIQLKGSTLFSIIKRKAGDEAFNDFMFYFLKSIKFNSTTIEDFNSRIQQKFGTDLLPYMEKWFSSKELPGYLIGGVKAVNVLDGDRLKTMVKFKISNTEKTEGIVLAQFRLGEGGGPGRGRFGGGGANAETIDKLLYLAGGQTKEVSYLLDGTPRNITINTLTSMNIPAELMLPLDNIEEDTKATPFEGETVSDIPVRLAEDGEFISDDEDPSFRYTKSDDKSLLQKLLLSDEQSADRFIGFNTWRAPRTWRATTNSGFFGKFIRSAHYVKAGNGNKKALWSIPIKGAGTYEVFSYMSKSSNRGRGGFGPGGGGDRGNQGTTGEYTYTIYHNAEKEEVTIDLKTIDNGWNSLGTFYCSGDTVKVELSNKTAAQVVVADAIKLVKQ